MVSKVPETNPIANARRLGKSPISIATANGSEDQRKISAAISIELCGTWRANSHARSRRPSATGTISEAFEGGLEFDIDLLTLDSMRHEGVRPNAGVKRAESAAPLERLVSFVYHFTHTDVYVELSIWQAT